MLIRTKIGRVRLCLETGEGLFSPKRLDDGTRALLSGVHFQPDDKVLDLACGYGAVGVFAAKFTRPDLVYLIDSDPKAVEYAKRNLSINGVQGAHVVLSNGFQEFREASFNKILCNPPFHVDFSVPKHFIEKGFNRLVMGGSMWMVTKRLEWYRNKLFSIFGGVRIVATGPYFVFEAEKRSQTYAQT